MLGSRTGMCSSSVGFRVGRMVCCRTWRSDMFQRLHEEDNTVERRVQLDGVSDKAICYNSIARCNERTGILYTHVDAPPGSGNWTSQHYQLPLSYLLRDNHDFFLDRIPIGQPGGHLGPTGPAGQIGSVRRSTAEGKCRACDTRQDKQVDIMPQPQQDYCV